MCNVCEIKNNKLCKISKAMPAITVWGLSLLESWFTTHLKKCELWAYEKILTLINTHFSGIMGYGRISWIFYSYYTLSHDMKLWVLYLQISTFISIRMAACYCSEQNMTISYDPCSWRVFFLSFFTDESQIQYLIGWDQSQILNENSSSILLLFPLLIPGFHDYIGHTLHLAVLLAISYYHYHIQLLWG